MSNQHRPSSPSFPPGVALIPEDFGDRLTTLKKMTGLSWEGMAVGMGVDSRQALRWRRGEAPNGGAMLSLVRLATRVPEGLAELLHDDVIVVRRRRP